jgi:hypothetical protein
MVYYTEDYLISGLGAISSGPKYHNVLENRSVSPDSGGGSKFQKNLVFGTLDNPLSQKPQYIFKINEI